jgi:hypothetical protein
MDEYFAGRIVPNLNLYTLKCTKLSNVFDKSGKYLVFFIKLKLTVEQRSVSMNRIELNK